LSKNMTQESLPVIPNAAAPDYYRQLVEFGRFVENECRPGCRYDLARWPNALWQKVQEQLLDGLRRFLDAGGNGIRMLQWYNSGIIIRATGKTIAFDLVPVPRYYGWPEPDGLTARLADAIDALFITHNHQDHCDEELIKACNVAGKPVFMHPDAALSGVEVIKSADGATVSIGQIVCTARHSCHVWRKKPEEVPLTAFEVGFAADFRIVFCGDADYTRGLAGVRPGAAALFITWRNPGPQYEEGHPEQTGNTLDAIKLVIAQFAPQRLILQHYGELDHVYKGFSASYEMAIGLIEKVEVPTSVHFWGDIVDLSEPLKKDSNA